MGPTNGKDVIKYYKYQASGPLFSIRGFSIDVKYLRLNNNKVQSWEATDKLWYDEEILPYQAADEEWMNKRVKAGILVLIPRLEVLVVLGREATEENK